MKFNYKTLIIVGLLLIIVISFIFIILKHSKNENKISDIKSISFWDAFSGRVYSVKDLDSKRNIVIYFFDPDCDICVSKAKLIVDNYQKFKNSQIFFVSTSACEIIKDFALNLNKKNDLNIKYCNATQKDIEREFGNIEFPTILLYNNQKKLLKRFNRFGNINEIIKLLPQNIK